jgi:hypothetical protein
LNSQHGADVLTKLEVRFERGAEIGCEGTQNH